MAKLLFRLNGVDEEEADEVRALLEQADIAVYETSQGRWRISLAAIWLVNAADHSVARALLDQYQADRQARMREQAKTLPSTWQSIKQRPVHAFFSLVAVLFILALVLLPFLTL